jgi:hypothetical protein
MAIIGLRPDDGPVARPDVRRSEEKGEETGMVTCPECDADIEIDETDIEEMEVGDPWDCIECNSRLRVLSLDPLEFEPDDDDDDDDRGDDETDEDDENDDGGDSDTTRYDDDHDDGGDDSDDDEDWDD